MLNLFKSWMVKHPTKSRQSTQRRVSLSRVESLESRSMLATLVPYITLQTNGNFVVDTRFSGSVTSGYFGGGRDNSAELDMVPSYGQPQVLQNSSGAPSAPPSFDGNSGEKLLPPPKEVPPTNDSTIPPAVPKTEDPWIPPVEKPSNDPLPPPPIESAGESDDPGGLVENGYGNPFDTGPADPSPEVVAADRETRAVLQMLTTLEYNVDRRNSTLESAVESPLAESAFDSLLRDLAESVHRTSAGVEREGGNVAIAVEEISDEFAAKYARNEAAESLEDVSVQIEGTAGRYQAFEVSTGEEAAMPARASRRVPSAATFETSVQAVEFADFEAPAESSDGEMVDVPAGEAVVEQVAVSVPLTASSPVVEESSKVTWTSAVGLIAVGITLQLFRERKFEAIRTNVANAWQHLLEVPNWFGRRAKSNRQQPAAQ